MTAAAFGLELRLRARSFLLAGIGLMTVAAITGALFPAFGESLGKVDLPEGVGDLLGGGDFASIAGWLDTEIASVYGPLVVAGSAIAAAAATIAGEEERRILALVLAHPVSRTRLLLSKGAAIALLVAGLGVACWLGLWSPSRWPAAASVPASWPRSRCTSRSSGSRSARSRWRSAASPAAARSRPAKPRRSPWRCTSSTGSRRSWRTGCST